MKTIEYLPHAIARGVTIESILATRVKADLPYVMNAIAAAPSPAKVNISPIIRAANFTTAVGTYPILGIFFIASKVDTQNVSTFDIATTGGIGVASFKVQDNVNEGVVFIPNAIGGATVTLAASGGDVLVASSAAAEDTTLQVGSDLTYPVTGMANVRITCLPLLADSKFASKLIEKVEEGSDAPLTAAINTYLDAARGVQVSSLYVQ